MRHTLTFFSDAFPMIPDPTPEGEEPWEDIDEVNPGLFGRRLADFVVRGLCAAGIAADEPGVEDYGWWVNLPGWGHRSFLVCTGGWGEPGQFHITFYPAKPKVWCWWRFVDARPCNEQMTQAVEKLMRESGLVRDMTWSD
ncbi:hypothetical protein [Novosphingobium sediminicola]|uniref:Uncharacterized protein n=1 Tax=Novosphingobium sediminicola TaxID=563162 RepID=A0A7W6G4Q1_9SPHN|nr:hypothetical protein [Novosphingobium sediminicola]MBB3953458.1 hypothetical protein [Novosphingobium sediminicola]